MTFENIGQLWHYDHTRPVSSLNLIDEKELYKCNNWINIKPYLATKNMSKHNKRDLYAEMLQELKSLVFLKQFNDNIYYFNDIYYFR